MEYNEKFMRRALQLAATARGNTSPNPMVGAVIVGPDGHTIIGEGYHRRCGEGHAEVNAVASVKDKALLHDATMYVTLEPCSHYGKTPPCAKLIIDSKIPRVVVGADDPFKEVAGRGIAMLRAAGVEVVTGVLAEESRRLNARFMTAHEQGRPWITLKWARSADGYIDTDRPDGQPARFSGLTSSTLTHRLRGIHDAILIGSQTMLADRPSLDSRLWGPARNPRPIVLDRSRRLSPSDITTREECIVMSDYADIPDLLRQLYSRGITSVLVEGGSRVLQSFIDSGLWDLARVETAPIRVGHHGAVKAPEIGRIPFKHYDIGANSISLFSNNDLITQDFSL